MTQKCQYDCRQELQKGAKLIVVREVMEGAKLIVVRTGIKSANVIVVRMVMEVPT